MANAANFLVTKQADTNDGVCDALDCSLREAVIASNNNLNSPVVDIITLPAGTYMLTVGAAGEDFAAAGDLDVREPLTINGAGARTTTINGTGNDRIFHVRAAISFQASGMTLTNGNALANAGGAVLNGSDGIVVLTDVAMIGNTAKDGGAIANSGGNDQMTVTRATLSGNSADKGGAVFSTGGGTRVTLTNVTITGNSATTEGGGIEADHLVLVNSTVVGNTAPAGKGGGVEKRGGQLYTATNSIVANNTGGDCTAAFTGGSNNIDGDGSCGFTTTADPKVGLLADNGGPTDTMALLAGSPAIEGGTNTGCPTEDQRSIARPDGLFCDIGAYEADTVIVSGTVFEDVNYGGGAGRDRATSSGVVRSGARVELYDTTGTYVGFTTTDASGNYSFTVPASQNYTVRVVNSTVTSSRTGYVVSLRSIQTYRTDASSGSAVSVTNLVGGQDPSVTDAANGSAGATMNTSTGVFTAVVTGTAQSITNVSVGTSDISGLDFGYNFDTIVNSNNSGQGSLRQFINNANALSNAGLAQAGLPAGEETSLFMISGPADLLGRPVDPGWDGSSFVITSTGASLSLTDPVRIDGYLQEGAQPNTVASPGLPDASLLIRLDGPAVVGDGFNITAGNSLVRGMIVTRFQGDGIELASADNTIEGNYIGTDATGATLGNLSSGIYILGASNLVGGSTPAARNIIADNGQDGVLLNGIGASTNVVRGNYIGANVAGNAGLGNVRTGIRVQSDSSGNVFGGAAAGEGNVVSDNGSGGLRFSGINSINNSAIGNKIGTDAAGTGNLGNGGYGVRIEGESGDTTIGGIGAGQGNTIAFNVGAGVSMVDDGGSSTPPYDNSIRGNSIHTNGGLGIDLDLNGVTANDAAPDGDDGSNKRQNYPALTLAGASATSTTMKGTLTSALNTTYDIDFYSNPAADVPSGFGEGEVYLGSDAVSTDPVTGVATIDTTLPVGVTVGHVVTATATDPDGNTSEFSQAVTVVANSSIQGTVYDDTNDSGTIDLGEQGIGTAWVKLVQGGSVLQVVQADPDTGAYSLADVVAGTYDVIVDDNNNVADLTPTAPVNWSFRTPATGSLSVTVAGADVTDQDLGLTFNFDLAADCTCGYEDGTFTQVPITIDGDVTDWAAVFSDGDNNACDATDDTDLDHPVQSTGRNLLRTAVTWDATYFSMWTQRVGSSNNTQNFVYYADTNTDGIQQNGEPVVVAKWQGNTGNVVLELYTYNDLGSGGDPVLDSNGFADGYSMPGDLTFVKTLTMPDGAGQGSTTGNIDGTQMEWTIEWTELGVPAGSAIGWHVSSTNSNPAAAGLGAQIDDNLGGCGGQCTGSNQFAGIVPTPIAAGGGDIIYAAHTFTNTGNGPDLFDFTWSWTGDFAPASVTYYQDLGTVGEFDPGVDVLLTDTDGDSDPDTGNLAAGATFELLIAIELPDPPASGVSSVTTAATSNFLPGCGGTITPVSGSVNDPLQIASDSFKRAFQVDGTPIADLSTVPSGLLVKFMIYVTNYGGPVSDMSLRDVLDPAFVYQGGTMKVDNTLVASVVCPGAVCDEATIFSQADGSGTVVGDGDAVTALIDADEASYDVGSLTLHLGDQNNVNNAQLDLAADSVWALVYTIRMQ